MPSRFDKEFRVVGTVVLVVMLVCMGIGWQIYRYEDCRAVGHSRLYCLLSVGK